MITCNLGLNENVCLTHLGDSVTTYCSVLGKGLVSHPDQLPPMLAICITPLLPFHCSNHDLYHTFINV